MLVGSTSYKRYIEDQTRFSFQLLLICIGEDFVSDLDLKVACLLLQKQHDHFGAPKPVIIPRERMAQLLEDEILAREGLFSVEQLNDIFVDALQKQSHEYEQRRMVLIRRASTNVSFADRSRNVWYFCLVATFPRAFHVVIPYLHVQSAVDLEWHCFELLHSTTLFSFSGDQLYW